MRMLATLLITTLLAGAAAPAWADDDDDAVATATDDDDDDDDDGAETEDIFGFTEGASTDEAGESEVSASAAVGLDRRGVEDDGDEPPSRMDYAAVEIEVEAEYAVTDRLKLGVGIGLVGIDARFADEFDTHRFDFGGLSAEAKFALVKASDALPLNIAVAAEAEWERISDESGATADSAALAVALLGDVAIVPDRLFAAGNLVLATESGEGEEDEPWEKESGIDVSLALSWQVVPKVFVGGEARVANAFEGALFDDHAGWAVFAGPTAYVGIGERFYLKAAWSNQLFGESDDDTGRDLNLVDFSHNTFLLGGGVSF